MTAEDAINVFKEQFCGLDAYCEIHRDGLCLTDGREVWWAIKALEQCTADIADVVRCRDCKYWEETLNGKGYCKDIIGFGRWWKGNDYCSYGEREDG